MQVRVGWMVFVLSVILLAAWTLEPTPLPAGQPAAIAVEQPAPIALATQGGPAAPALDVPATLQSDAFWLGVILAMILALASVYVRWAVLEYA
jgi:hypothetical protein